MVQIGQLWKEIMEPSEEFTPVPFWFFNDEPDEIKIRLQLEDYIRKGVHAMVLHPRIGIPEYIPYLSPQFFDVIRYIVKTASEIGMKIVLYDEGMYPSGSAHGMVVEENPEFASKGITITDEADERKVLAIMPNGKYLVYGFTGGTIRGIHFGEDDGEARAPKSADILNAQAVKKFIQLTHERYYKELKEYFGKTIIGFFTDEPCALGRNASDYREWAEGMEEEILAAGGQLTELHALFDGGENKTTSIYRKLIKYHLRETFYRPLSEWCKSHGIALMGHPAESDDIEEELYFQVPGQDLILRRVVPKTGGLSGKDSVQAKLAADIARLLGCQRNLNECFGVCSRNDTPWYFTGEDMKWYIDWLGVRGTNLFVPHAFYYSVAGKRKDERPPDVGPMNIWWPYYRLFSDYIKRISWLMTDSADCARVAVLCDNNNVPAEEVAPLYENQIGFHYLPAAMMKKGKEDNGSLYIGSSCYDIILNLLGSEYDSICAFSEIQLAHSAEEIIKYSQTDKKNLLHTVVTETKEKNLRAVHRIRRENDLYFLSNEGDSSIKTRIQLINMRNPVWIDLWEGKAYSCKSIEVTDPAVWFDLELKPCETALIVSDPSEELKAISDRKREAENWTNRFKLRREEKNRRIYGCTVDTNEDTTIQEDFFVTGEEMAECYCNGTLAGVSFWNPHTFHLGSCLKEGKNDIEIIMTGNAANLYSDADIFYGLTGEL